MGNRRDVTLVGLWGILNLCSFFFVLDGAATLLFLTLATDHKIKVAWLGIPGIVGYHLITRNYWWDSTGFPEKFAFLQAIWIIMATVASIQSIYLFVASLRES